jgi:hypothetical protein
MVVSWSSFSGKVAGRILGALPVCIWLVCLVGAGSSPVAAYTLPATGQTLCYGDTAQIECPRPGQEYYGQDGNYQAGAAMHYTVQGTNSDMVLDVVTGLTWLRNPYGRDYYADGAAYCAALSLEGYADWRVPSQRELITMLDIGKAEPKWNAVFNGGYSQAGYFSSNAYSGDATQQIGLVFTDAYVIIHAANTLGFMRCARGDALESTYSSDGATVTDLSTGLVWENQGNSTKYTWKDALTYCENLNLGGKSDWRLPNYKELLSIVDYTKNNPAISAPFSAQSTSYWTSSTRYDHPNNGFYVDFTTGYASYYFSKSYTNCVRCVRGGITNAVVAVLAHAPSSPTIARTATITVGGTGVSSYMYRLDNGGWSQALSITTPISLAGLSAGSHVLTVLGQNSHGVWQNLDTPTTAAWTVVAPGSAAVQMLLLNQ